MSPGLKRRCLFRRAPPLSAWHSLLGVRASCGQTLVGGLHSLSGRGFGHVPQGWDQPSSEGICSRASGGPLTASCPLWQSDWHFSCSRSIDTRPVWAWKEGAEQKHVWVAVHLRGGPVCRRASHGIEAGCQQRHWGEKKHRSLQGSSNTQLCGWDPCFCASQ